MTHTVRRMSGPRDTIFALSSGRPPAAIAVVRVSGPGAKNAMLTLAGRVPEPRHAALLKLMSHGSESALERGPPEPIDDALVLWFPGPRSETGEDTAEFHLHGGLAVVAAVLFALGRIEGLRPAEPGEFTRRAFLNGKIDLVRVEGLADLIGAQTEAQRRQAYRQMRGLLGDHAEQWRRRLTEALALVEASIDFPDEGIDAKGVVGSALVIANELEREIRDLLTTSSRGERLREGLTVAIAGPVNVGKSSILNRLAKRPAAIVSPHAGTTRDPIEVHLDLEGFPVTMIDTAGIRETADPVEEEGVRRARARANNADLVLWVMDGTLTQPLPPPSDLAKPDAPPVWVVVNKIDLVEEARMSERFADPDAEDPKGFLVSAQTGLNFGEFVAAISGFAKRFFSVGVEAAVLTRQRHRSTLTECVEALRRANDEGGGWGREEVVAEELRLAARAVGKLVGKVDIENVLDVIFRDFCIGK
jgi:tRNA modification GTPase